MITEDLDDTAMDSKEKSELLELAAKEYDGLANRASEAKVAITEDYKELPPLSGRDLWIGQGAPEEDGSA